MRLFGLCTAIACLHVASAQKWKVDEGCDPFRPDEIRQAWMEAGKTARTALNVLDKHGSDEKVKDMIEHCIGKDESGEKLGAARAALEGLAAYDKVETKDLHLLQETNTLRNTYLVIVCDLAHITKKTNGPDPVFLDQITDKTFRLSNNKAFAYCFDSKLTIEEAVDLEVPAVLTVTSDIMRQDDYDAKVAVNKAQGLRPPLRKDYATPQAGRPNTIGLCAWWLKFMYSDKDRVHGLTKANLEKLNDPTFLATLGDDIKPVDVLLESMFGTFMHEGTHTTQGTQTDDFATDTMDCYGWYCIGQLQNPYNADTPTGLGISLASYDLGYYVTREGKVLKITD